MFAVDHAATALIIKRRFPSVSLTPLLLSVQAMELAWVGLNYLGIERTTTDIAVHSVADIHLAHMPYSHSVATAAIGALLAWLFVEKGLGRRVLGRAIGIGVLSHLVLDLVTHAPDIALWPGSSWPPLGLGLYDRAPMWGFALEIVYGLFCWWVYRGRLSLLALIVCGNLANITLFSAAIAGPEEYLAGRPLMVVTLVFIQIVTTLALVGVLASRSAAAPRPTTLAVDKIIALDINGSAQRIRMCAERDGLAPLLVVQAGPGLPLLHEVGRFQRVLGLEGDFLVCYWDQRGCGAASLPDARSVSMRQQVDDLLAVLRWLHTEVRQPIVLLGISLGATMALQAVEHDRDHHSRAVIAISPDSQTAMSDASARDFLQQQSAGNRRVAEAVTTLGDPPFVDPASFLRRERLLADLGSIEHGRRFSALMRETLAGMLKTYGVIGTAKAMRNMHVVQRKLLPELISLDLLAHTPRVAIPVHYVFGEDDALTPAAVVRDLPEKVAAPGSTVTVLPDAAHMVHFDRPQAVRSIVVGVLGDETRTSAERRSAPARLV